MSLSLCVASAAFAAIDPFYTNIYDRGVSYFNAGDYASAQRDLKVAAFGFVEDLELFESAYIYSAIAANKLQNERDLHTDVFRVMAAEHVRHVYTSLTLPQAIRDQFEALAKKVLTPTDLAFLHSPATAAPAPGPRPPAPTPTPAPAPAPQPQTQPQTQSPPQTQPVAVVAPPVKPSPQPQKPAAQPPSTATLADALAALNQGDLPKARAIYTALLNGPNLTHASLIEIGAGLYRARAFSDATRAFERAGNLAKGEERYHYYYAVSLYETGHYELAKRELDAALPYVERTADVERYRAKIDGSIKR